MRRLHRLKQRVAVESDQGVMFRPVSTRPYAQLREQYEATVAPWRKRGPQTDDEHRMFAEYQIARRTSARLSELYDRLAPDLALGPLEVNEDGSEFVWPDEEEGDDDWVDAAGMPLDPNDREYFGPRYRRRDLPDFEDSGPG